MTDIKYQLSRERALQLVAANKVETLDPGQILDVFHSQTSILQHLPDQVGRIDPCSNELILYNPYRAARPQATPESTLPADCPVCQGNTTRIVDLVDLSEGFSFINTNLYPAVYPHSGALQGDLSPAGPTVKFDAWGLHFLQWTSSIHHRDWLNMDVTDLQSVLCRLGVLERTLLEAQFAPPETNSVWGDQPS